MRKAINFVGRAALAAPFIIMGYEAAREPGVRVEAVKKAPWAFAQDHADELVRVNGASMVAGGIGLASGILSRTAAAGLVLSTAMTTIAGHDFWNIDDPAQRAGQRIEFLKNLGMVGGLLIHVSHKHHRRSTSHHHHH
ncbi:MAG: DoxX family protein [Actinomycetaceae bacterium]|nr:DoxX family protein [Actinomycetaceae bacterium]MDY6083430.1 DoxX family protein [Actinomycetaceae bacterium]